MHGLINKALQSFVTQTYGRGLWEQACRQADLGFCDFEAMLTYDPAQTDAVLRAVCGILRRDRAEVLEDLGTFLVTHPSVPGIRRLLRFCGDGFEDFLLSLDDLADRVQLAVSDLRLPQMELRTDGPGEFRLICQDGLPGYDRVIMGVLRAMADDYGALVTLDVPDGTGGSPQIMIRLVASRFADGKAFSLGAGLR